MTSQHVHDGTTTQQFRGVMAQVPAAVAVVSVRAGGSPHGTTVSAFTSLSMDPPMLLVSLDNASLSLIPGIGGLLAARSASPQQLDRHILDEDV